MCEVEVKVYSPETELEAAFKRFIKHVFPDNNSSVYVVDESDEEATKNFWKENIAIDTDSIPPILFITFSGAEPQGCLEFLRFATDRWEVWNPTRGASLRPVLKYLLRIQELTNV